MLKHREVAQSAGANVLFKLVNYPVVSQSISKVNHLDIRTSETTSAQSLEHYKTSTSEKIYTVLCYQPCTRQNSRTVLFCPFPNCVSRGQPSALTVVVQGMLFQQLQSPSVVFEFQVSLHGVPSNELFGTVRTRKCFTLTATALVTM